MAKNHHESEYHKRIAHMRAKHMRWAKEGVILSDEALSEGLETNKTEIDRARHEATLV